MNKKRIKGQSAMEYLMTYGWAILIIAVVLGALFSLGIFGGSTTTACIAQPGYLCTGPLMTLPATTTQGISGLAVLQFTMGQNTGAQIYNIQLSCAATSTSGGLPNGSGFSGNNFFPVSATGVAENSVTDEGILGLVTTSLTLVSGQQQLITNLPCFSSTAGAPIANTVAIGTPFSGGLWLNYTQGSSTPGGTNAWITTKTASISLKVT